MENFFSSCIQNLLEMLFGPVLVKKATQILGMFSSKIRAYPTDKTRHRTQQIDWLIKNSGFDDRRPSNRNRKDEAKDGLYHFGSK
jgi:hypothetical protein